MGYLYMYLWHLGKKFTKMLVSRDSLLEHFIQTDPNVHRGMRLCDDNIVKYLQYPLMTIELYVEWISVNVNSLKGHMS